MPDFDKAVELLKCFLIGALGLGGMGVVLLLLVVACVKGWPFVVLAFALALATHITWDIRHS